MRARLAVIPLVASLALLGGCATQKPSNTPTSPAVTTPAGNGLDKLTAEEIRAKAQTTLKAQKSFAVKGTGVEDGEKMAMDLAFGDGNVAGNVQTAGFTIDIVLIGNDLYMKAPDAFWGGLGQDAAAMSLLKGKWVKLDGSKEEFESFKTIASTDAMLKPEGKVTKGEAKTIGGVPAIGLIAEDKSIIYVATEGEPLPLQIVDADGNALDFTYKNVAEIKAPAASDVFDLSKVM